MARKPKKLGDLLRSIRARLEISIPALAEKLGVNKNTLGDYEREERLPDPEFLAVFARVTGWDVSKLVEARFESSLHSSQFVQVLKRLRGATDAAVEFALRRCGLTKMELATMQEAANRDGLDVDGLERLFGSRYPALNHSMVRAEQPKPGYAYIPLYNVSASAGSGTLIEQEWVTDLLAFREDWLRSELNASAGDVVLLFVQGHSMEPDLRPGDVVMIDRRDTTAQHEAAYVIRMDNALVVKELQRLPGGVIRVKSRNPSYDAFDRNVSDIESGDFVIIGRVVWACRRF